MTRRLILSGFWLIMAAGCAPVISQETLRTVDKQISFETILKDPDVYRGKDVLLGGSIIETTPLPGKTMIVVLQYPLGFREKPSRDGESKGRFIISAAGFFDPAIYRTGRLITVAGTVMGKEMRLLGEIQFPYPLVAGKELYLWPSEYANDLPRFYFGIGVGKTF